MAIKSLEEIRKNIPIEVMVRVSIQAHFLYKNGLSFLIPLNEDGSDVKKYREKYNEIIKEAEELVGHVLDDIKEWKANGCPE